MSLSFFLYTSKIVYFILTSICLYLKYKAKVKDFTTSNPTWTSQFLDKIFYRDYFISPTAQPYYICQFILLILSNKNIRIVYKLKFVLAF